MKKNNKQAIVYIIIALLVAALVVVVLLFGCNRSDIPGFKKCKNSEINLHYRFDKTDRTGEKINIGDYPCGRVTLLFEKDTLTSMSESERLWEVKDSAFINEGVLMMRIGESATFAIFADSLAKFFQMPSQYRHGTNQIIYYDILIDDVVTAEELAQEKANFYAEMNRLQAEEPGLIAKYVAEHHSTATPRENGLYVIVNRAGRGNAVATGRKVSINYTGRLLDGTVFDSNVESVAKAADKYDARRTYEPMTYTVGKISLIKGWMEGIDGLAAGTNVTLVIPSSLGYGPTGTQDGTIPPYSPLVFDIDILSVQ